MPTPTLYILLADDDVDDCMLFKEALNELSVSVSLKTVNNGVQLMRLLTTASGPLPDMLFLDLNMPRKTGFECLSEIKLDKKLKSLPVIIYSTSLDKQVVNLLYEKGAQLYIRKPADFLLLKKAILEAISRIKVNGSSSPSKENFVMQVK